MLYGLNTWFDKGLCLESFSGVVMCLADWREPGPGHAGAAGSPCDGPHLAGEWPGHAYGYLQVCRHWKRPR